MRLSTELERVEAAEDLFALFKIDYEPRVLAVHRLHVIKRFGREVAAIDASDPPLDEANRWLRYAAALKRAHDYYAAGAPAGRHEFFGVERGLVQLAARPRRKD